MNLASGNSSANPGIHLLSYSNRSGFMAASCVAQNNIPLIEKFDRGIPASHLLVKEVVDRLACWKNC